jgi:hypothetical protein
LFLSKQIKTKKEEGRTTKNIQHEPNNVDFK